MKNLSIYTTAIFWFFVNQGCFSDDDLVDYDTLSNVEYETDEIGLPNSRGYVMKNQENESKPHMARVNRLLSRMTLKQKVGQLMMVGFKGKQMTGRTRNLILEQHVGAVVIYKRNIKDNEQLVKLIHNIRKTMRSEIQPFIAVDQEGGNVVRVRSDVAVLPGAMTLGATNDPELAFQVGQAMAMDLRILGFDMNLAPVLDVNQNPQNPVINIRALGDNPQSVAKLGAYFIQGQQSVGMATVAKHFPGHGTTSLDSHIASPVINLSREQLEKSELLPFRKAIAANLDAIMTAHLLIPALEPKKIPATLSHKIITGLLREEMGFDGVVITDDLEMRAISPSRDVGQVAVQAILAGADMVMAIWTLRKQRQVYQALLSAAKSGKISKKRLNTSLRRILTLKAKRGTLDSLHEKRVNIAEVLPNLDHEILVQRIANRGISLIRNKHSYIPICSGNNVLVVSPKRYFLRQLKRQLPDVSTKTITLEPKRKQLQRELQNLIDLSNKHNLVVIAVVNAYQAWLVQNLQRKTKTPLLVVSLGSPYLLRHFPEVDGYLCAYSYSPTAQKAAADALCGLTSITGRLPVNITKRYRRGYGLTIPKRDCSTTAALQPAPVTN